MRKASVVKIIIASVCALSLIAVMVVGIVLGGFSSETIGFSIGFGCNYNETGYSAGNFESDDTPINLDIDWKAGDITIKTSSDGKLRLTETEGQSDNNTMRVKYENGTVYVKPCKSGLIISKLENKDLTVEIPEGCVLSTVEIDTGAGNLTLTDVSATTAEIDMGAGNMKTESCSVISFDLDMGAGNLTLGGTFSDISADIGAGNATIDGSFSNLELDAGAGNTDIKTTNSPYEIDIDTAGGDVTITLPADCPGFDADLDSAVGTISVSGFDTDTHAIHRATYGNGQTKIEVDLAAGNLSIRKAG